MKKKEARNDSYGTIIVPIYCFFNHKCTVVQNRNAQWPKVRNKRLKKAKNVMYTSAFGKKK